MKLSHQSHFSAVVSCPGRRCSAFLLYVLLAFGLCRYAHAAPLSGTKTVGPTGDYASLTAAIADVNAMGNGLGGALVLELQSAYVSTVETFPLTIPALTGASATNTLTIRPAADATALAISSADTTAATVDLNGANYVTFDGRPGGTGTAKQLTIANTNTTGVTLRFINEASNNTIKFVALQSVNTSNGTVLFSTTTGANGNDNNTIDTCDIGDGAGTPLVGIFSFGTTTTPAQNNSGNTVTNCNIFNFYNANNTSSGVWLDLGNTDWTISGNSFYQTATRTAVARTVNAIFINTASGNNFIVTGNFIGGSAPSCGGAAWTTTGTSAAYLFQGIRLNVGTTTASSVQGNTVANIVWTSSSTASTLPGVWSGIYATAGNVNSGTVTGNTIGSGTGTGSISVTTSGDGGTSFGIGSSSSGGMNIANNTIGSITTNGLGVSASLTAISVTAGANTISNNTVGSTGTPSPLTANLNSLNAATSSTSITAQQVTGILSSSSGGASITGNTVANLNNNYNSTATGGQIRGIATSAGVNTITGNTIRNLSTKSQNANTTTSQSVYGITDTSGTAGQTVSRNTVHSLANAAASAAVSATGIYFFGPTSGTNVVARNFVHSLTVSSSSASAVVNGMQFATGTFIAQNNMVRVGLKADGTSTAGASTVRGIYDNGTTPGRNFYHNSVYLGGTQSSGASTTRAFDGSSGASNARTYQDNIFVNARSNGGTATGKHYAVVYGGTTVNPAGLTAGGNLLYAPNTANGGVLGLYSSSDRTTLAAWQAATGLDGTSAVGDPLFVAPVGDASTVDLHLQASNPAESGGIALTVALTGSPTTVTDDFDGEARSTLTPVDVGADAGNFTSSGDIFPPGISYPLLTSGSTANRVLTGWVTIADVVGVSGGANAPRLYYKKSTDADVFGGNTSADDGWKYVTATGSGPYSFTMDYSLIKGGSVSAGDTVQYFVVAQDAANNLGSSPAGATASASPPVQNVNSHGAVNSFSIVGPIISGTVTVGSGGTYPSLSGAGGLFAALNSAVFTGNTVVNITSDLTEDGSTVLSQLNSNNYPPPAVTIQPDSASMRTISGSSTAGLITLNGADGVTIDGRFGGSGRYLTFRNTDTGNASSTIRFQNDSSNNTIRNCVVEGASVGGNGVINFSTGTVTGNDNNLITDCQVRDLTTAAGVPLKLIVASGSSPAMNTGDTLSNNELFNFTGTGISIGSVGDEYWTISGNNIYEVNASTSSSLRGIESFSLGASVISGNYLHDLVTTGGQSLGIIFFSASGTTTVSGNRITAFNVTAATTDVRGILAQGTAGSTVNIVNNQITLIPATSGSVLLAGIYDNGTANTVVKAYYNSVVIGGTETGTRNSWGSYRGQTDTHTARDNLFLNFRTGGSGSHFAAGNEGSGGNYTVSNNVYAGTGATASNFMDFSATAGTAAPVDYATWQSGTGDTSPSASTPGGNYSTMMFVDASTGDLHLASGGNVLVNGAGTPIAGVTTDFDGDLRSLTTPTIGADEVPSGLSTNANLAALSLSAGVLSPVFSASHTTYTTSVSHGTTAITVTPVTADTNAIAAVSPVSPVALAVGLNTITVLVTAEDGITTKTYTITATRNTPFQDWAASNSVGTDPNALGANGIKNLQNFAFGVNPTTGGSGALVFNGTFGAGGTIGATGQPITRIEGTAVRALFIRRKDFASLGLTYTVEFSNDLSGWQDSVDAPVVLADDGTNQVVAVPFPPSLSMNGFFKVRTSLP